MSKLVLPEEELQLILQDYQNGESLMGICKKYHHGVSTLKRIFTEKGIHLRNQKEAVATDVARMRNSMSQKNYDIVEDFFDNQNPDMAYMLGFLMADGNVGKNNNRIQIALSVVDRELLDKIYSKIGGSPVLEYKAYNNTYCCWYCANFHIKQKLIEYDIIPNKTGKAKIPQKLEKQYYPDFIRGYFDGDGSIYEDNAVGLQFVSHNTEILQNIIDYFETQGVPPVKIYTDIRANTNYSIRYRTKSALMIYDILYYDISCLKLERKYSKFSNIVQKKKSSTRLHTSESGEKIC